MAPWVGHNGAMTDGGSYRKEPYRQVARKASVHPTPNS